MLWASDIAATGFSGAESGQVRIGDAVVIFAQGPIGLGATAGAKLMGASLITYHFSLDEISEGYRLFGEQSDGVLKVAIKP